MPETAERSRMIEAARRAHEQQAKAWGHSSGGANELPRTGEVYLLNGKGDHRVAWVVALKDPADGRFLVIPGDCGTQVGSADVALQDDPRSAARIIRCRYAGWISLEDLSAGTRVGAVSETTLARIRESWWSLGEVYDDGSAQVCDTDEDPEYTDWLEEIVEPARKALPRFLPEAERSLVVAPSFRPSSLFRIAAGVLILGIGLASFQVWRQDQDLRNLRATFETVEEQRLEDLERVSEEHQQEMDRLAREGQAAKQFLEKAHKVALARSQQKAEKISQGLKLRVKALQSLFRDSGQLTVVRNPVLVFLETDRSSGSLEALEGASHILFEFAAPVEVGKHFRVQVVREGESAALWSGDKLLPDNAGVVHFALPAVLVGLGNISVQIDQCNAMECLPYRIYYLNIRDNDE